jgi:hypothetical protein
MENNVAYQVGGSSFVTEDGNEIGVMRGNLSVNPTGAAAHVESRVDIHDFGHGGHGFWLQGPGVAVVDNIAAGSPDAAFVFFTSTTKTRFDAVNLDDPALAAGQKTVPVGAVPLKRFDGNTALASKSGVELWFHQHKMTDGETYIENFTSWNTRNSGIETHYSGRITIQDSLLIGNMYRFYGVGVGATHQTHDVTISNVRAEGFEVGIFAASRGANVINNITLNAIKGIYIELALDSIRTIDIAGAFVFKTATADQLQGQPQYRIFLNGSVDFGSRSLAATLSPNRIRVTGTNGSASELYFVEQAASYVPFPRSVARGFVPDAYLGLTNLQLRQRFGVSLGGRLPAYDVTAYPGYRGLLDFSPGR